MSGYQELNKPLEKLMILGLGAQCKYAAETWVRLGGRVAGVVALGDEDDQEFAGLRVLGRTGDLPRLLRELTPRVVVCNADPARKMLAVDRLTELGARFAILAHPEASIASTAEVGEGAIINARAVIQPFARIGAHAMVHAGVVVEHDCLVEDFAVLAPNATLTGHVHVGRGGVVYAGAVVLPRVSIGRGATVGAGAVVRTDVADGVTVAGVPAREIGGIPRGRD